MNILMLSSNIFNQGTYWRVYEFAKCLVNYGHHVTIVATSPSRKINIETFSLLGVNVLLSPDIFNGSLRSGWDPYNTLTRISALIPKNFDIVHSFESRPTVIYPSLALHNQGVKLIMDWCDWFGRGGSVEERPNPIIRTLLRPVETYYEEHFRSRALATTVICSTLYKRAISLGVPENTISIIPNGFNVSNWVYIDKVSAREKLNINKNLFLVGYIGSLFVRDAKFMAQTCNLIHNSLNNVKFIHIGHSTYSARDYVLNPDSFIETGSVSHEMMNTYIAACDICWLPFSNTNANNGRFPYKLSNYLSSGKPVIATAVGDAAELIAKEQIGIISQDTPDDLAQKVVELLSDHEKRKMFEDRAIYTSNNPKYSWDERTNQLINIYSKLL